MKNNEEYLTPKKASEFLGVHPVTLRRWAEEGKLEHIKINGRDRRYSKTALLELAGKNSIEQRKKVFYIRSSNGNKQLMQTQQELLENQYGNPDKIYTDKDSGLNEKRRGLQSLIKAIKNDEIDTIYITAKDRLTRFGYTYIEEICSIYNTKIVILDSNKTKTIYEELIEDFMSLIASFSGKYYKIRGNENKKKFLNKITQELQKQQNNQQQGDEV